jgi:hypothetical protein
MSAATRCQWVLLRSPRRVSSIRLNHSIVFSAPSGIASLPNLIASHQCTREVGSADSKKELAMPVVLIHQGPTVTAENYRATVQKLAGKDELESVSDWPVGGLLFHAAGESPSGFRVVDVWESQDACDAFGQHLRPILEEVGITDPPEMYPVETFVSS